MRCPTGTRDALVRFKETGDSNELEVFARGLLARNIDDEYLPVLEAGSQDLRIIEDLGIDSLTMTELAINFEDALDIELIDEELKELKTLGDVKGHLLNRYRVKQEK